MIRDGEEVRFDWRRGGTAVAGLLAALILVAMVFLVKYANDARERALSAERHSYDVALVVRNVSSNVSRSEAALARFVLDEDQKTGSIYAADWDLAGFQISQLAKLMRGNPEQQPRRAPARSSTASSKKSPGPSGRRFASASRRACSRRPRRTASPII
jgi:hypothetical protein